MAAQTDGVTTYRVIITHARLDRPLIMDMIATTPARAAKWGRLAAFHMYRDGDMLDAATAAFRIHPGTCVGQGHERCECPGPAPDAIAMIGGHPVTYGQVSA